MLRQNIVLIGMPGAGKSTIGVLLAKTLGMAFVDTDIVIQEKAGRLLQEIINQDGVAGFLRLEENVICELQATQSVIATGGSAVLSKRAVDHLKETGLLVYLKLCYDEIERRIDNMSTRGIAIEQGRTLRDLYDERIALYEKYADLIVDCSVSTMEEVVLKMVNALRAFQ